VSFVLSNRSTLATWTSILEQLAGALRARGSRRVFPGIDHGRIEFFVAEWSSAEYRDLCRADAPEFLAAFDAFAEAWKAAT
jgi:hypothetical protein